MESAIQLLRQACDYLYNGMTHMGSVVDQKRNTEKVQQVVGEVIAQLQKMQATFEEKSKRVETISTCLDELSGESMNVCNRLDGMEGRLGLESQQHQVSLREVQAAVNQCRGDIQGLTQGIAEVQMDTQSRDQRSFELEELIFNFNVNLEEGLKECREVTQQVRHIPESGQVSATDYQEHARLVKQALDEPRAQLTSHEKKFQDGEKQMRLTVLNGDPLLSH